MVGNCRYPACRRKEAVRKEHKVMATKLSDGRQRANHGVKRKDRLDLVSFFLRGFNRGSLRFACVEITNKFGRLQHKPVSPGLTRP